MRRIASLFLFCALAAHAQYTAKTIVFKDAGPYTDAQLQQAWEIKAGQAFTRADLQNAAQHLIDSGAFEELSPTLAGPLKTITLTVALKPLDDKKLLPVTFENIVWFTPQELEDGLHKRVPLYIGKLPEAGNLQEQVRAAITAMLAEKGITATVSVMETAPSPDRPYSTMAYSVEHPAVVLQSVSLANVAPEMREAVSAIVRSAVSKPYYEGNGTSTLDNILGVYRDNGYLDVKLQDMQRTPTLNGDKVEVRLTGSVQPGEVYHVKSIAWEGSPQLSVADFNKQATLHPGDAASRKNLRETIKLLTAAYEHQGYTYAEVNPHPTQDDATHTVAYAFTVNLGEQYRVGSIKITGLTSDQELAMRKNFKMKPGDLYDAGYVKDFMVQNTALQFLRNYNAKFEAKTEAATHLADVAINFSPRYVR